MTDRFAGFLFPAASGRLFTAALLGALGAATAVAQRVDNPYAFTTLAGGAEISGALNGTGSAARFSSPAGVAVDSAGNVYVADANNYAVREVTPAGVVTTFAGQLGVSGNQNGTGTGAQFGVLGGIAIDSGGNLYVTDDTYGTVRKITSGGVVTTLVASGLNQPEGLAVDSAGNVYVADAGNFVIRKVTAGGTMTTFAGVLNQSESTTGPVASAKFDYPTGVAVDGAGNVYVVDTAASVILKISGGVVTTLAGQSSNPGYADGAAAASVFAHPYAIAADAAGDLFVTDDATLVREISAAGAVTTLGGNPGISGALNGTGINALFYGPTGIAVTGAGLLYVADTNNQTVRKGVLVGTGAAPTIQYQPQSASVSAGGSVTLMVTASGANLTYQWYLNGNAVVGATTDDLFISNAGPSNAGSYTVVVANANGTVTSTAAVLTVSGTALPTITSQPNANGSTITINSAGGGTTVALTVGAANATGYQWQLNGVNVNQANASGATSPTLLLTGAGAANQGSYTCVVSGGGGSLSSNAVQLTVVNTVNAGRLGNLSVLTQAGNGSKPLTVGFEVGGAGVAGSQTLLIRGDGPLLAAAPFSLTGTLANPVINLFASGSSTSLASNSNWGANQAAVTAAEANTYAYPLATGSLDAAMVSTLAPGAYSVQITGNPNGTAVGTALAEVFDDTASGAYTLATPRLINLSCLAQINAGSGNSLTAGFVVGGTTAKTVLIRAWGPALVPAPFSVSGAMPDPLLKVYNTTNSADTLLATNAGWGGNPQVVTAGGLVYDYAWSSASSADSAVLLTLAPGNYTAQVSSVSGVGGTTLVEVFEVP
jgi:sugar lactone lactonase YvrE